MIFENMINCQLCRLCKDRKQIVWGVGNELSPKLMLIGEAPGEQEDEEGVPFVGLAGQKVDKILKYVGLERSDIYITNTNLCRPPNNRPPQADEIRSCNQRLIQEILDVNPSLIVCLGKTATMALTGVNEIKRLADYFPANPTIVSIGGKNFPIIVTYHPSYHLRNPVKAREITLPHWNMVKTYVN